MTYDEAKELLKAKKQEEVLRGFDDLSGDEQKMLIQQVEAVDTAQAASDLVNLRYGAGLTTYLQVLATQNATLIQKRQLVTLQSRALSLQANLSRALGGGYRPEFSASAPTLPTLVDQS